MKKCPRCGRLSHNSAKFCKYCGYRFPVQTQSSVNNNQANKKACPYCGYLNRPNAKFCVNCGKSLVGNPQPKNSSSVSKTPRQAQARGASQTSSNSNNVKSNVSNNSKHTFSSESKSQSQPQPQTRERYERTQSRTQGQPNSNSNPNSNGYRRVNTNQTQANQTTKPNYSRSWNKANQSFSKATNYSTNYFQWLKDCFSHPSHINAGHPMFGITSFIVEAFILFVTGVLTKINGGDQIFYSMRSLFNSFPISNMYDAQSFFSPVGCFLMAACTFVIFVGANYLCQTVGSNGHKVNFFSATNNLASNTILALPALGLTLISVLISSSTLTQLFAFLSALILNGGLAITVYKMLKFSKLDCVYWSAIAIATNFFATGLVNMLLSTLINA